MDASNETKDPVRCPEAEISFLKLMIWQEITALNKQIQELTDRLVGLEAKLATRSKFQLKLSERYKKHV
jgi:hypothetical protein